MKARGEALRARANVQFGDSQSQKSTVSGLTAAEKYVLLYRGENA